MTSQILSFYTSIVAFLVRPIRPLLFAPAYPALPDAMIVSHFPHGPTVYFTLHSVNLRHDLASAHQSTVSEQYPHLIFENFSSKLGVRIGDVLKYLFPVPKEDSKRVMTFANEGDYISFRCVELATRRRM